MTFSYSAREIITKIKKLTKWFLRIFWGGGGGGSERLTRRTLYLDVWGASLARRVVSLGKELYSTLSLFTQVYKWVQATYCWKGGGGVE